MIVKRKKRLKNAELIPCDRILPGASRPRKNFDPAEDALLAESLSRYGLLQPILVRRRGEYFELVTGERRLRAARLLGWVEIACIVLDLTNRNGAEYALIENLHRKTLDIFEEAQTLEALMKTWRFTQEELANRLGQSQSTIANKLRILRLSADEQRLVSEHSLSFRHARALLKIQDEKLRFFALNFIISKEYSARQSEKFIEALLDHPDEFIIPLRPKPIVCTAEPKPVRKFVVKDVRLFVNSVDKAIYSIREAGFSVQAEKQDEDGYISYKIRIPKFDKL